MTSNQQKTILVIGANGMLGSDLVQVFENANYNVLSATRKDFDITNKQEVESFFNKHNFDLAINCSAYTNVDKAESEKEQAFLVNEQGAKNIAIATAKKNVPVIYISTDYVFDGTKNSPYFPTDKPNPISVYGASKLAGEIATAKENPKHYIVRTSWLYAKHGKNFVNTMLELAKTHSEIKVVNDQIGCPTSTIELSEMIKDLVEKQNPYGIYHFCGKKAMSWFDFAKEIFKENNIDVKVTPISTEEFPRPARRPRRSILKNEKTKMEQNKPLLSVCCITYNHEKYVKEGIESIWNQDYKNIEIIVIEDGSTDKTLEELNNLAKVSKFPMKILTQKNTGNIGYNLNRTIKEAKGEYIIFTSLDDYYYPNVFGFLMEKILENKNIDFISVKPPLNMICFDNSLYDYNKLSAKELLNFEILGGAFWLHNTIWKKTIVDAVNGFDEDIIGDDIVLRTKILKYLDKNNDELKKFIFVDKKIFHHRILSTSISHNPERQCQILFEVCERYFNGKTSKVYDSWILNAIKSHINNNKFKDAVRLIFLDKKNKSKIKTINKTLFFLIKTFIKYQLKLIKKIVNKVKFKISLSHFKNRKVKYKIFDLETKGDDRGSLISLEQNKNTPFKIKRVYYIFNTEKDVRRGFHAHKNLKQVLICVSGSCKILVDDGKNKENFLLNSSEQGLLIKQMIWREMYDFSQDCVLMVVASELYDEDDYIRNYNNFLKILKVSSNNK